ncbi:MAG: hypothetical protein LLG06_11660 [Desulfobacteraceae bacterium]|nr:hypothetical protein [Desulfobacteraceae bacterium]
MPKKPKQKKEFRLISIVERWLDPKNERVVFLAGDIATNSEFGAFYYAADGNLQRVASPWLPLVDSAAIARRNLNRYAQRMGWIEIPEPRQVHLLLALVMLTPPGIGEIEEWTALECGLAARWAVATHLRAAGNPVRVPPVPVVIETWQLRRSQVEGICA